MWVGKINSQKFLRDGTALSYPTPLSRRLDSPYLKLSLSLFLNLWLSFQRQTKQKFSECCFPVGWTHWKLLQEFPCASVAERRSLFLLFSLNWIHMVPKKGLLWAHFPPLRGHFALFSFRFFTILFPNPIFLQLSKVHLSGALGGRSRNSKQKFLHLNRMVFILIRSD